MIWDLFWTFFKLGFVSFGGGYAMIPLIEHEVLQHNWMTATEFTDAVTLAGMAPGSVAMNSAVYVGYAASGWIGSTAASIGIVLPSIILMFLVATLFYRMYHNHWVQAALDGMKPAVMALIAYAAFNMAVHSGLLNGYARYTWFSIVIFAVMLFALIRWKLHPIAVILISGIAGIILYV
ncbi:chromate transporter [Paenibacillus assamensis]|uniref:chromate transporter n=1 Tax=Paenibacillus assamensis TaxID=311244 RepID=UPI000422CF28|nr:chromate transporter [Paenibacillus assamensis]